MSLFDDRTVFTLETIMGLSPIHLIHSRCAEHRATRGITPTRCSVYKKYLLREIRVNFFQCVSTHQEVSGLVRAMYAKELCAIKHSNQSYVVADQSLAGDFVFKNYWFCHDCLRISVLLIRKHNAIVFTISATWTIQMVHVSV
jgi:hypothetical protein